MSGHRLSVMSQTVPIDFHSFLPKHARSEAKNKIKEVIFCCVASTSVSAPVPSNAFFVARVVLNGNLIRRKVMRNFVRQLACYASSGMIALFVVTPTGEDRILPELPEAKTPVTLAAATDPLTGRSEFRYSGNKIPPVIRVQPGSVLKIEYKNDLAVQSREECLDHPCMNMTNLHFHGLHVSPEAPQDDVLDMMAMPGETLHYSVQVPPQQPPGLYWYHTHPHGESYRQDLDGMSGAIVVEGIDRYVPEVANIRERILVLRDLVLPDDAADKRRVMESVSMQTTTGFWILDPFVALRAGFGFWIGISFTARSLSSFVGRLP